MLHPSRISDELAIVASSCRENTAGEERFEVSGSDADMVPQAQVRQALVEQPRDVVGVAAQNGRHVRAGHPPGTHAVPSPSGAPRASDGLVGANAARAAQMRQGSSRSIRSAYSASLQ